MKLKNSFQMIDILSERAYNVSTRIGGDYMLDVNMIIANNIQAAVSYTHLTLPTTTLV